MNGTCLFADRDIPLGHSPRGQNPEIEWEPYFCVLNQLDQTFTAYRSEEMSVSTAIAIAQKIQNRYSHNTESHIAISDK